MAAVAALYAFNGYGSVVFLGEEIHEAPKRIARVAFIALGLAAVTELVPLLAVLVGAPDLKSLIASESPIPFFAQAVGGPVGSKIVGVCVALANFNCMIVVALMGGRQLYATGRDRVWPAVISDALSKVHSRFNSPWVATLVAGGASAALCFVRLSLLEILVASGVAAQYAMLCIAVIRGRLTGATGGEGTYRMPLFPLFPAAALIALVVVIWASWQDEHTGRLGLIAVAATLVLSALYYLAFLRKSGWAHRGPTAIK
jgi:amino acid transporter